MNFLFFSRSVISHENIVITNEIRIDDDSSILADKILRDLFDRAHCNNIPTCIQPILEYEHRTKKLFFLFILLPIFLVI